MFIQETSFLGGILKILLNAGALFAVAYFLKNVTFDHFKDAVIVAVILGVLNFTIVPILSFFTTPIRIITLGMFSFIIDAAMLMVSAHFVEGFRLKSFWAAIVMALFVGVLNALLFTIYF